MPAYNTRRKSLSLTALGIHLPNSSRAHRSNSKSTPTTESAPTPPTKRVKRSHDENEPPSPLSSSPSKLGSPGATVLEDQPKSRRAAEHTPPPSPGDVVLASRIDTEGINDDIVIAVIEQLEKTGNRPHLIKELATVLAATNSSVAHSANPAALLSSRLSLYLNKRPWTALSPCPLAKELIPVHPRKVFFYLTTTPRQPLPENSDDIIAPSIHPLKQLTPSISDPSIVEDDVDMDLIDRSRLSPSPEIDLFSPELEHVNSPICPPTPGDTFSGRSSINPDGTQEHRSRPNRAPSPPLEADEKGFTETATAVRARGMSLHEPQVQVSIETTRESRIVEVVEETPEMRQRRDRELGYELFGHGHPGLSVPAHKLQSSPMIPPRQDHPATLTKLSLTLQTGDIEMAESILSPEMVEVDELDAMFSGF